MRFAGEEYQRDIRLEAAYLIGKLCHSSPPIPKLFLASGGLESMTKVIDLDFTSHKDFILVGVDCMLKILEVVDSDDCLVIWSEAGIIEKLLYLLDSISAYSRDYLLKVCNLLLLFSTVNSI